jgi:hypothetical protein
LYFHYSKCWLFNTHSWYASLDAAKTIAAARESYVINPAALNGVLLGWWIVEKMLLI